MEVALSLRMFVIIATILLTAYAVRLIATGRLQLKYSLLWFLFAVVALLGAVFPDPLFALAGLVGFEQPSNFVLFVGLLFALVIIMTLTVVISRLSQYVSSLVQEVALLRHRIDGAEADRERR